MRLFRRWAIPAILLAAAAAGCMNTESLYQDIRASRSAAFHQWQADRQAEKASETVLKGKLSLVDGLKVALVNNKPLLAVLQDKEVARGRVVESYSQALPKLNAAGNYTRLDKVPSIDIGGQSFPLGFVNNFSASLQVSQPVFHGGAISAQMRAARLGQYLADEGVRSQVQRTIYDVAKAYFDAMLAQQLYAVNEDAVKSAQSHLDDVKRKRGEGVASEFDVLRAQVDLSNFSAEMIQQQNRIHLARTSLLKIMGVSQDSDVELTDEIAYEPMKPVLEEAVRLAHENRPDLYQAELGVRLQQQALAIAKSTYWPYVDATVAQEWAKPDPHNSILNEWGSAWNAGVTVSWPIFTGFARTGRVIQEKAALKKRNIELLDAQERAVFEAQQAILSLKDAEEFVESQKMSLQRAEEGLRLAMVGYREGVNTEVEVTDARAALTRAKGLHYQSVYTHAVARLDLQQAMGILGPRAGDNKVPSEPPSKPSHIDEFAVPSEAAPKDKDKEPVGTPDKEKVPAPAENQGG